MAKTSQPSGIAKLLPRSTPGVMVMCATVHNQRGEPVFEGAYKYLIRERDNKE